MADHACVQADRLRPARDQSSAPAWRRGDRSLSALVAVAAYVRRAVGGARHPDPRDGARAADRHRAQSGRDAAGVPARHRVLREDAAALGRRRCSACASRSATSSRSALGTGILVVVVDGADDRRRASGWRARSAGRAPYGALAGVGTAVCGASATLATATVLPDYRGKDADVVFVVVAVNALATLAMVIYPLLCARARLRRPAPPA